MKILQTIASPKQFLAGLIIAAIFLVATPARPVSATLTTRYVNGATGSDSGNCSISACRTIGYAITQAVDENIIQIAAGTYAERITVNKNLTFTGSGMDATILDGGGGGRVVGINSGKVAAFNNLTIQNGNAGDQNGGGIESNGTLSLSRVKVANNTSKFGGGISSTGALTMTDSIISGNHADTDTSSVGGGLALLGTNSVVTLTRVTISNNIATSYSGGIHNQTNNSGGGSVTLTNVTISGNTAKLNGAMVNTNSAVTRVVNSTIADNHYSAGGGNGGIANYAIISFQNTIIAGNQDSNCALGGGTWTSLGNNLDSRNDCSFTATGDLYDSDPLLGTLADNGGFTPTMALLASSPAINTGNDTICAAAVGDPTFGAGGVDQRGVIRPQGSHCDMGAFEVLTSLPGAFNKLGPTNESYGQANGLTLTWDASSGAAGYAFCIDTTNDNACSGSWISTGTATSADISGLSLSTTYYWQVRATGPTYANGGSGTGTWWVLRTGLFADVPVAGKEWMRNWIEGFYNAGITTGCGAGPRIYCPEREVTRAEMSVFLLRAKHGAGYAPPAITGIFGDVPVAGKEWMQAWIEQFYREGITTGCGAGPVYCPERAVTRAEMAVFVLRAKHGASYVPPPSTGVFLDVPVLGLEWMQPWIEQFYHEGITTGCGAGPLYCPERNVTRAEMAVFIGRAYSIPLAP